MTATIHRTWLLALLLLFGVYGCARHGNPDIPVSAESVAAGSSVTRAGNPDDLLGTALKVGDTLPSVTLIDRLMRPRSTDEFRGKTVLLSIAPSLDTQVCERQTHLLGDASEKELPPDIVRVTITRDLPFAHNRFDEHTGFSHILYLSDYKNADFGRNTGLLMDDLRLLARAVIIVDQRGKVRYMQVVPEVAHLPDMSKAFKVAREINEED